MGWYALSYELCGECDILQNWHLLDAETEEEAAEEAAAAGFEYPVNGIELDVDTL